ncbi:hypothetical protein P9112_011401 [Eukaryota sp. TZLM1-RC]
MIKFDPKQPLWCVCIPGLGCTSDDFDNLSSYLNINCFCLDLRNFPLEISSIQEFTETISCIIQHIKTKYNLGEPSMIVGHSFGGSLAMECFHLANIIVSLEGNVNKDCCGIISQQISSYSREDFIQHFDEFLDVVGKKHSLYYWSTMAVSWEPASLHHASELLVEWSHNRGEELCHVINTERFYYCYSQKVRPLHAIKMLQRCGLDETHIVEIPSCGHFMLKDNPEFVSRFLNTIATESGGNLP